MQIPPPALKVTLASPRPAGLDWQVGQLLQATVVKPAPPGEGTLVRVGGLELALKLPQTPAEGNRLTLQVVRAGAQPVLALVERGGAALPAVAADASARPAPAHPAPGIALPGAASWLSSLLPAQGGQTALLSALWALQQQPARLAELPPGVRDAVEQLFRQLPTADQATRPEGLRQAVQASGLFHEAGLAAVAAGSAAGPAANLKSALLSLATRLRALPGPPSAALPGTRPVDTPPPRPGALPSPQPRIETPPALLGREALLETLRSRAESALARLALHQWSSAESSESGLPRWLMELPLRSGNGIDLVHLLLEREPDQPEAEEQASWRAEFALDLPELGPVRVRISVTGDQVRTRFWAENEETVGRIRAELPRLMKSLENRRLEVKDLGCHAGAPPAPTEARPQRPLLDDHA
ncbi:flagellar hook-length control protein FliK [Thioalkalivibrio sulfidiphilus]|uniref:flagellar hook-length control protein FliK n=1 Tax=Thioalkalivibrio sulfidiphilus TaxID=1033854 RepID=UPI000360E75B|nr:flagellar hook-length control protein FliK [Thioalkalivibrio sulfidiphilus]